MPQEISDEASLPPRFVVRQGCKGWMVYDRQRKAPALIGLKLAVNLTKEQAEHIERLLMGEWKGKHST